MPARREQGEYNTTVTSTGNEVNFPSLTVPIFRVSRALKHDMMTKLSSGDKKLSLYERKLGKSEETKWPRRGSP